MENQFQIGDAAQLIHGYTPTYTISSINEEKQLATCVWYDTKKRVTKTEDIPLNALKKFIKPPPPDLSNLLPR